MNHSSVRSWGETKAEMSTYIITSMRRSRPPPAWFESVLLSEWDTFSMDIELRNDQIRVILLTANFSICLVMCMDVIGY